MRHTFDRAGVERLLAHSLASKEHTKLYGLQDTGPGLELVGDHGVYLMSTGEPGLLLDEADTRFDPTRGQNQQFVVYADEVNPDRLPFDEWWAAKRAGFGADDGVDYLPADMVQGGLRQRPGPLVLDVSRGRILVVTQ